MKPNKLPKPNAIKGDNVPSGGITLNIGCGFNHYNGCVNVDKYEACEPDCILDLEKQVWPWEENSVDMVIARHAMEHIGESEASLIHFWKELYRVLKPGGIVNMTVPHPLSDDFIGD